MTNDEVPKPERSPNSEFGFWASSFIRHSPFGCGRAALGSHSQTKPLSL